MEDGVRRWLVDISQWNPSQDQFSFLVSRLPPHEQAPVTRFIRFEDRKRALVSRLLQYTLVHEVLGIPFGKIILDRTIEGKPYLNLEWDFPFPNFNFNVSHHGDYVGIASESVCLVGLDIFSLVVPQQETALEFIKNFSSYFTVLEWKKIVNAGISDEILAEFCRYWCLKEAYVKATGAGLGFGLHRLEFHHTNWTNISVCIDGVESREWRFCLFELDKKHWASIAKGHPRKAVDSYQRALTNVDIEDEKYWNRLCLPDPGFILRAVEQLLPL